MTRISVLIPVLNGAATLGRALESLRAQTFNDFEAIIINDGSTDETETIVRAFVAQDSRFRYEALDHNCGVSAARNRALTLAEGEWIALLDADDWYEPERLERLLQDAEALGADAVFDNLQVFDHVTGAVSECTCFGGKNEPVRLTALDLFKGDTPFARYAIGFAHPMVRASFLREKGLLYDERLRLSEDFAFLTEIALRGGVIYALPFAAYVYVYRLSPSSGAVSPFSRSDSDYVQIVESCERIKASYEPLLSPAARRALERRRRLFDRLVWARRVRQQAVLHDVRGVLALLLRRPDVLGFILKARFLRWVRRASPRLNACCRG